MSPEPVAVVGLAARVPDADSADTFWANLLAARNSIHRLSKEEVLAAGEDPALVAQPNYVFARPLLDDVWAFDHEYFGLSRREAELRNPQHRLFLELCDTALQHAGVVPDRFDGSIGVYGGCASDRFVEDHIRSDPALMRQVGEMVALVSNNIDYLASYVSFRLGLRGPSLAVRTACSTSLVATHLACQALRAGECDVALAGGVEIETPYGRGYLHVEGGIDAEDGVCRPLDIDAGGTVFGSGGGVVALKRLSDAERDGDRIMALILGSAVNNDGPDRAGFTAPSSTGQSEVIAEAITVAGVDPADISYVELHGTGTKVGDPIEIRGLHDGMAMTASGELAVGQCAIGSVKSNLGHLGPASGVVGLIKTVLALQHEKIPPTINMRRVNPALELDRRPFRVADSTIPWPRVAGVPRLAGVSSFGFGGTNAHMVLKEAPEQPRPTTAAGPQLLVWSGTDPQTRERSGEALLTAAAGPDDLAAMAYTSQTRRRALRYRGALLADGSAAEDARAATLGDGSRRTAAFLFPGQGAQFPRMGLDLGRWLPGQTDATRRYLTMFGDALGIDLVHIWEQEEQPARLAATVHAQPLLFAVELALAESLQELGVRPTVVTGHSVGELVAATVAGVMTAEDALRVVAERARLMQSMPPGSMLAVAASADEVRNRLIPGVWISAVNGARQTVVGGADDRVTALQEVLAEAGIRGRRLETSHAFHTPMMAEAVTGCTAILERIALKPPTLRMVSAASGAELTDEQATDPRFWAEQLVRPVLFERALDHLPTAAAVLIEVGPGPAVGALARRHPAVEAAGHSVVELLTAHRKQHVLGALGVIWANGVDIDFDRMPRDSRPPVFPIPIYPFRRTEFLLPDRSALPAVAGERPAVPQPAAGDMPMVTDPEPVFALPIWRPAGVLAAGTGTTAKVRRQAVVVLPADEAAAAFVRRTVQQAGYRVLPITVGDRLEVQDFGAVVRDNRPQDVEAALGRFASAGRLDLIVHARACSPAVAAADGEGPGTALVLEVLHLQRQALLLRERQSAPLPVLILSRAAVAVTAGEPLTAARAAVTAVVRSAVLEYGPRTARMLDVEAVSERVLAAEIDSPMLPDPVLAVRGRQAWRPGRLRLPLADCPPSLLQPDGRYLITGGLGAVGLAVAQALAHTGLQPSLVLLSRTTDRDDVTVAQRIAEIEAAGAEVTMLAGDVGDRAAMTALFERITSEQGPVHGIFHAAGVAGAALIVNRDSADAAVVLRPKVAGSVILRDIARATPSVRFLTLFSSRAALNGLVGSADYAAGNAFMDALAAAGPVDRHTSVISVNWPTWHGMGMAGGGGNTVVRRSRLAPADWVVAEHRLDGVPLLPATGIVELIVQAVRDLPGTAGDIVELTEVTLSSPLTVERGTDVSVELVPAGQSWTATVTSRPDGASGAARFHATAQVRRRPAGPARTADLAHECAGWKELDPPRHPPSRFVFGPRFDAVTRRWRGADPEVTIGALELPAAYEEDLDRHPVHPALLDRALALQLRPGDHIPFVYRRIVVRHDLPGQVLARLSLRPDSGGRVTVDAVLCDAAGRVIVEVDGFTKIRLSGQKDVTLSVATPSPGPAPRIGLSTGVTEEQGVTAMLRLLTEHGTAQIVVVPGEEWQEDGPETVPDHTPVPVTTPTPTSAAVPPGPSVGPATTSIVDTVRSIWSETLGVPEMAGEADFFDAGGDSLTAIQMVSRLQDHYPVPLGVSDLFDAPTPIALARMIEGRL